MDLKTPLKLKKNPSYFSEEGVSSLGLEITQVFAEEKNFETHTIPLLCEPKEESLEGKQFYIKKML